MACFTKKTKLVIGAGGALAINFALINDDFKKVALNYPNESYSELVGWGTTASSEAMVVGHLHNTWLTDTTKIAPPPDGSSFRAWDIDEPVRWNPSSGQWFGPRRST